MMMTQSVASSIRLGIPSCVSKSTTACKFNYHVVDGKVVIVDHEQDNDLDEEDRAILDDLSEARRTVP